MQNRIWVVTNGDPQAAPLAYFSTEPSADRYQSTLVSRYALGKNLSLYGQQLANEADVWRLGLGPTVLQKSLDESIEALPGAWKVKVDETCRMVSCGFSMQHCSARASIHYRAGMHTIMEAYGATPHAALDAARKAMVAYLGKNRSGR